MLRKSQPFLKAFRKILRNIGAKKFNCLEVTSVVKKNVMGVTYPHMSARARNIQKRPYRAHSSFSGRIGLHLRRTCTAKREGRMMK